MKLPSRRIFLAVEFTVLITLIAMLGLGALRASSGYATSVLNLQQDYRQTQILLAEIPTDLYYASILVRDYVLDPSTDEEEPLLRQLDRLRVSIERRLEILSRLVPGSAAEVARIQSEVGSYFQAVEPVFHWNAAQKAAFRQSLLQERLLLHRNTIVSLTRKVNELNAENVRREEVSLERRKASQQGLLQGMLVASLVVGVVVAILSFTRVTALQQRAEAQHRRIELAERELRMLSRSLVQEQEDERRHLSRELHDVVGQMVTAMGMELANLASVRSISADRFHERLDEAKRLNTDTLRTVRDLAMGLRPSMLDDLGLAPALEWQGRDFSRRSGIPVNVVLDGSLDDLPESHRTAIFRIVQEALTNCARHAAATSIRVSAHGASDRLVLTIQDNGVGFDAVNPARKGLGLLGIQERVSELDGAFEVHSQPGKGTMLKVEVPLSRTVSI